MLLWLCGPQTTEAAAAEAAAAEMAHALSTRPVDEVSHPSSLWNLEASAVQELPLLWSAAP